MKKKYIILIVIFAVVLIGVGLFVQIKNNKKSGKTSVLDKEVFEKKITKKHCIENLCMDTVTIKYYDDDTGSLEFIITNTDENNNQVSGNFVLTPDSSTPLTIYFSEILAEDSLYVKVGFSDENVTKMKDYTLSNLVAEENDEV